MREEDFELDERIEAERDSEYQRGLDLCYEGSKEEDIVENCPWCNKKTYEFSILSGWVCLACDYTPGADLRGGRYS